MVANGPEAQHYASDQSYDLVVLDLNRNGWIGLDALRNIRLKKPDQPELRVAGANVEEDRVRGLNAGADDFVPWCDAGIVLGAQFCRRAIWSWTGSRMACNDRAGQIDLSPKEFSLLELLMRQAGHLCRVRQ